MSTYRVPDLQTLTLPLTRVGYAILAGSSEEEIKVFRLIPHRQLHLSPDALNNGRKGSPQYLETAAARCSPPWFSYITWFPLTSGGSSQIRGGRLPTYHLGRSGLGLPVSLEWLVMAYVQNDHTQDSSPSPSVSSPAFPPRLAPYYPAKTVPQSSIWPFFTLKPIPY